MGNKTYEEKYYEYDEFWNWNLLPKRNHDYDRVQVISSNLPNDISNLLDLGCGNGVFSNYLKQKENKFSIFSLDRSWAALKYVKTERIISNISCLPFKNKQFDCVASLEVIEHLTNDIYNKSIIEIARVAKKYVIITIPNNQRIGINHTKCPACKSVFDQDLHFRSFDLKKMESLFDKNNFKCIELMEIGRFKELLFIQKLINKIRTNPFKFMLSPLCPVCGYENDKFSSYIQNSNLSESNSMKIIFKNYLLKKIDYYWPKVIKYNWILAIYKRTV